MPTAPSALPPFGVAEIRKRTHAIQEVMKGVMKEGTHYGTIPGTPKPSLWKAGAEVLCMTFRLTPMLESRVTIDDPEAEWGFTSFRRDGSIVNGTCTGYFEVEAFCTVYGPAGEVLSRSGARCNNREAKYRGLSLFDVRNTIQKMAEKRAFVSAVLMATGASDIFTQDIEDFPEVTTERTLPQSGQDTKQGSVLSAEHAPVESRPSQNRTAKNGLGLTPKREAWLRRAAEESKMPTEVVERCIADLSQQGAAAMKAFFDQLSRNKSAAFRPYVAA